MSYPDHTQAMLAQVPLTENTSQLHKAVSEYDSLIDCLSQRLDMVLRPSVPTAAPRDQAPEPGAGSALRSELQVIYNRLYNLNQRLHELTERVDL